MEYYVDNIFVRSPVSGRTVAPESLYFTNPVKCFPSDGTGSNREPAGAERSNCRPYLLEEVETIKPSCVVPTGRHITASLLSAAGRSGEGFLETVLGPIETDCRRWSRYRIRRTRIGGSVPIFRVQNEGGYVTTEAEVGRSRIKYIGKYHRKGLITLSKLWIIPMSGHVGNGIECECGGTVSIDESGQFSTRAGCDSCSKKYAITVTCILGEHSASDC